MLKYHGSSANRAVRLGADWEQWVDLAEDSEWAYRAGGIYERLCGNWSASSKAFLEAARRAKNPVDRQSFAVGAIDSLARSGEIGEAESLAKRLNRNLARLGHPGLAARAMFNLANAFLYQDRFQEAIQVFKKVVDPLLEGGFEIEAQSAKLGLSSAQLFSGNPRAALSAATEVVAGAKALGADYLADLAKINQALAHNLTQQPETAHGILLSLLDSGNLSKVDQSRAREYLGDSFLKLNLWQNAISAYVLAEKGVKLPVHRGHLAFGIAEAQEAMGSLPEASRSYARAADFFQQSGARGWTAQALAKSASLSGDGDLKSILDDATSYGTFHALSIHLSLARASRERALAALKLARSGGYVDLEWKALHLISSHSKNPGVWYRKMFRSIQTKRLSLSSIVARQNYLADKSGALQEYFDWLLEHPTQMRIQELSQALVDLRSVTLLDQIVARTSLEPEIRERLEELRSSIPLEESRHISEGSRKVTRASSLREIHEEASSILLNIKSASAGTHLGHSSAPLILETTGDTLCLEGDSFSRTGLTSKQLKEKLQWLRFDLLAPLADKNAASEETLKSLREIAEPFQSLLVRESPLVCPDKLTWQLPWTALRACLGVEGECRVSFHPALKGREPSMTGRNLIWYGPAPDLPNAEGEVAIIRELLGGCDVVTSAAEARKSLSGEITAIHVVGHAVHEEGCSAMSSFSFPDGKVFAYEIAAAPCSVELATLSACETGSVGSGQRMEPDGLVRAFLAKGAGMAIGSLWPLDDEAAKLLFSCFYQRFVSGQGLLGALFEARCITRDWKAHPYYWGGVSAYAGKSE